MSPSLKLNPETNIAAQKFGQAVDRLRWHPIFRHLMQEVTILRQYNSQCPVDGYALVTSQGVIHAHPTRRAEPGEWEYVLAHCLLHLGFGHFDEPQHGNPEEWNAACDIYIAQFLKELKLGRPPRELHFPEKEEELIHWRAVSEEKLYHKLCEEGLPEKLLPCGVAGQSESDMRFVPAPPPASLKKRRSKNPPAPPVNWSKLLGLGLAGAVEAAVEQAAWTIAESKPRNGPAQRAKGWFINHYPLLAALAASFEIVDDPQVCSRLGISIGAVNPEAREIYINPLAGLDEEQTRFVMAHELLHVGLAHQQRRQGRDPFLWNVACDFVINAWLVEMGVGELPQRGLLYDPDLKDQSAEAIYDWIVTNRRRYRRLMTFRGQELGDLLEGEGVRWANGVDLDEFFRRCLAQGLDYHQSQGRGYLPAGLIEDIQALGQPPLPWDVELARWFDDYFALLEKRRSYARASRRQSSTPDIPRPNWTMNDRHEDARTFGVVLDTSGSMERGLLAKALGAIASYSIAREVPAVRVVFCDASSYDQGYMPPEEIAGRVRVRGRGGTILQPGIDLLEAASDFPSDAPILIITDGYCDRVQIRREHAFLLPVNNTLPFIPKGKVFRFS